MRPKPRTLAVIVFLLTFGLYLGTNYDGAFVFDDGPNILQNSAVTEFHPASLESWWAAAFESLAWLRPLPNLSFAWEWYLFGGNRAAFHALNDLLHALAAVFLFLAILEFLRLHGRYLRDEQEMAWTAAAGALLWALHPVQTSAVTYVVQRMAVMAGLFSFGAFWLYLRGRRLGGPGSYAGSAVFYSLALASKENACVFPVVVLLYEWILGRPEEKRERRLRLALLFAAMIPPVLMAGAYALDSPGHFALGQMPGRDFTLWERLLTAPRCYFRYLVLLTFPVRQALIYGFPASSGLLAPGTTIASLVGLSSLLGTAVLLRRRAPAVSFGMLSFAATLGPESTFLNLDLFYVHRLYLPSAALLPLVPSGLSLLASRLHCSRRLVVVALVILLSGCAVLSAFRNRDWRSRLRLWEKNVHDWPGSNYARLNYGSELADKGDLTGAIEQLEAAVAIRPQYARAQFYLANYLVRTGQIDEAIEHYEKAYKENPTFDAFDYLPRTIEVSPRFAVAFSGIARALEKQGRLQEAAGYYERSLAINPKDPAVLLHDGLTLLLLGHELGAVLRLSAATEIAPQDALPHYYLALIYDKEGNSALANEEYRKSCGLGYSDGCSARSGAIKTSSSVRQQVGNALSSQGNLEDSLIWYRKAVETAPKDSAARVNLAVTLAELGRPQEAVPELLEAIRLDPNLAAAHFNLGSAYSDLGESAKAAASFRGACDLGHARACERAREVR